MPTPTLLVPLPALTGPIDWPRMCACCGGPAEKGTGASGGPASGWEFPLCGVDNSDHRDPVTVWTQDGALGFRSYRYHREFCRANKLG